MDDSREPDEDTTDNVDPKLGIKAHLHEDGQWGQEYSQNASDNLFAVHCWWREVVGSWRRKRRETRWWNVFVGATGPAAAHIFPWLVLVSIMKLRKEPRACAQRVSGD